jgi:hypothetical protein
MSQDQPTSATRRRFLGAATVATAATAATLTASPIAQGRQADEIRVAAQTPTEAKPTSPPAPIAKERDWSKPAAMAIPKGGAFKQEQGRYGLIYPRTPANYGFSILAKVKPGREAAVREYGSTIEKAVADAPEVLAPLKLHYLRWVLFEIKGDTYFMYQGIFDTDFDKVHRGRRGALRFDWHHDGVQILRVPENGKTMCPRSTSFPEHQCPSFLSMRNTLMRPPMRSRKSEGKGAMSTMLDQMQ